MYAITMIAIRRRAHAEVIRIAFPGKDTQKEKDISHIKQK